MPSNAPAVFLRQATCPHVGHVNQPLQSAWHVDKQSCLLRGRIDTGASKFRPTRRPCRHRHDSWTHVSALLFKASAGQRELMGSNIGAEVYYFTELNKTDRPLVMSVIECVECHAPGPSPGTPGGFQTGLTNEARNQATRQA